MAGATFERLITRTVPSSVSVRASTPPPTACDIFMWVMLTRGPRASSKRYARFQGRLPSAHPSAGFRTYRHADAGARDRRECARLQRRAFRAAEAPSIPEPAQLVTVWQTQPGNDVRRVAPANFLDWRAASSFAGLAAYDLRRRTLPGDEPERIMVATVSSNFFQVLGVDALTGRTFREPTSVGGVWDVVLREDLWRRRFGAEHGVIGRAIRLDDESLTVAGIVRVAHAFPEDVFAWTQARHDVPELSTAIPDIRTVRDARYLRVIGRMRDGVTMTRAQTEMDAIAVRLREAYPDENAETGVNVDGLQEHLTGASAQTLWILFGVVAVRNGDCVCQRCGAVHGGGPRPRARIADPCCAGCVPRPPGEAVVHRKPGARGNREHDRRQPGLAPASADRTPSGRYPCLGTIEIDGTVIAFALAIGVLTTLASGVLRD